MGAPSEHRERRHEPGHRPYRDHRRRILPGPRLAGRQPDRAGPGRRHPRGVAHPATSRNRSGLRRRTRPLRRQSSRDQRNDRLFRRPDGRGAHRDHLRRVDRLPRPGRHGLSPSPARRGRRPARLGHFRSTGGVRARPFADRRATQVHPHRPAYARQDPPIMATSPRSPTPSLACSPSRSPIAMPK